jgi:hypothetical protein
MRVIQTTAHVGSDGMLRLQVPTEQRNQDVHVALVVETLTPVPVEKAADRWEAVREQMIAAGLRVPAPGVRNPGPVQPIELSGPTASEILVSDRR